jgi:hypothetical protein
MLTANEDTRQARKLYGWAKGGFENTICFGDDLELI